ncbi:MAG: peptidyl-prolyl cis-trans isomerase [Candidatus Eisenbacteria bacterium]|nr:peptidyl-prolyl cis-trans isomerase [Candidatus Eisenbacteria bacterium]
MFLFERLRKSMKIVLWITIFAFVGFIFLIWGMDVQRSSGPNPGTIGSVNRQRIQTTSYQQALQDSYAQYEKQTGKKVSENEEGTIRSSTWDRLVNEILINQELKRRKISASDAEVEYYIRLSPPPEVAESPAFQTDGKFDPMKYKQILQNPQYDLTGLETLVRSTIPIRKLEELVASSAKVSNNELRSYFEAGTGKANFSYVLARPGAFQINPDNISEQELRTFYGANTDQFRVPDAAKMQYLVVPKTPSARDEGDALAEVNDLWREARAGTDFAQLATDYSEGPEASNGGDIGRLVPRESMPSEQADVAFSLKPGEISSPFRDKRGFNIIKLEEKKTEGGVVKVRFRRILMPVDPSNETLSEIRTKVTDVSAAASKMSLKDAAKQAGWEVKETGVFYKGNLSPILPTEESTKDFAFKNKVGTVSNPVETDRAWYILEVTEKIPSHVPQFEEALPRVKKVAAMRKQEELARQALQAVASKLSQGLTLEQAATAASLAVTRANDITRNDPVPEIGREPALIGAAFALEPGQSSPVLQGNAGFFIVRLDHRTALDEVAFESQRLAMKAQILEQKRMIAVSLWLDQMRKSARIQDFRSQVLGF